jgi:hypothetical protein
VANEHDEAALNADAWAIFEVAIGPGNVLGTFRVDIISSPAGLASVAVELDVAGLQSRRQELQNAILSSAVSTRQRCRANTARVLP